MERNSCKSLSLGLSILFVVFAWLGKGSEKLGVGDR